MDPGSQHSCCAAFGTEEEKGPNPISSRTQPRVSSGCSALQLRTVQTMAEISVEKNLSIIFPRSHDDGARGDRSAVEGFGVEWPVT
jgi:hypothetical protein